MQNEKYIRNKFGIFAAIHTAILQNAINMQAKRSYRRPKKIKLHLDRHDHDRIKAAQEKRARKCAKRRLILAMNGGN